MKKYALKAIFLFVCFLVTSCELSNVRDLTAENQSRLVLNQLHASEIADKNQQLSIVRRFLGKRPSEVKLWNSEPLNSLLHQILGNEYTGFIELMKNASPLKEEKLIYSIGSFPDLSRIGFGYIIIDPEKNLLRVGMVKPGNHRTFGAGTSELATPEEIERKFKSIL